MYANFKCTLEKTGGTKKIRYIPYGNAYKQCVATTARIIVGLTIIEEMLITLSVSEVHLCNPHILTND